MNFLLRKQFFEKIITEGGLELIVLDPFLDSLCNTAFKNIGLAPGIPDMFSAPSGCSDFNHQIKSINWLNCNKALIQFVFSKGWYCTVISVLMSRSTLIAFTKLFNLVFKKMETSKIMFGSKPAARAYKCGKQIR